jgi:hypothetical protein
VRLALRTAALATVLACALPASLAGADSFTPVRLGITIAQVARLHGRLPITVRVSADAGVLDVRTAPLRIRVKLAPECGGTFQYTPGPVLLDKQLRPQPTTGRSYEAVARGAGRPTAYGQQTVCTFLDEEGDQRTFASDQSIEVDVSRACTRRADRYDATRRKLRRARRAGRGVRRARRRARLARRAALSACGRGVPL